MAQNNTLGMNRTFPIYNADGTAFHDLELKKSTVESVVMSLGDKVTGDVFYKDNTLAVTMQEYIIVDDVKYMLVSPPTIVREGMVSDNTQLKGMTKYSFTFYHPMYMLGNFPFTDIAVTQDEEKYLSQNKTFSWIGNLFDMVAKLNKNLQGTQWVVGTNIEHYEQDGVTETSMWQKAAKIPHEPLSFDKTYVSEVLKTSYETWEIPFIVDQIASTDALYSQGKHFLILFGTPSNEILDEQDEPYIFRFGQGVGLKNNSRTPKNNKIVTRIVGYGSESNIPFGYPQIQWFGDQTWKYTVNNDLSAEGSLPIYKGILGGQYVNLIKHPFTRKTLMPSVYRNTLFNKVSPYMPDGTLNQNFDPTIELVDYYDADGSYVNPVVEGAESVEIHQFDDIKPEFTEHSIVDAFAYDSEHEEAISYATFIGRMNGLIVNAINENEKVQLTLYRDSVDAGMTYSDEGEEGGSYTWHRNLNIVDEYYMRVRYTSDSANFNWLVVRKNTVVPATQWDDTMDDDGKYKQSYFKMTLPQLDFDLYACASITEEMKINMRSGACIGCTFDIAVDWDDYKKNFYDSDGNFVPDGEQRDLTKYPKTNLGQATFVVKKDLDTFGTLMPNTYQQPHSGDEFVILGISLPTTYITNAEARLEDAAKEYMRENNVHYYEYPLKFDEHFLATHTDILSQIRNNTIVRFQYGEELPMELYVKQITIKYGEKPLPQYDITLTDDVEIVLNQIGQVTDDVSRMRVQVSELQKYYSQNLIQEINRKLSKVVDDVCQGRITFQQGLDAIGSVIFHDEVRSPQFESGLYTGRGWRIDNLGNAEFESIRVRSYLEVVELLVNRLQAQEGDTLFTDNDQIDRVDRIVNETDGSVSYVLSLKEKYQGYITGQMYGNVIKGIINTLAAKQAGVSDYQGQTVEVDGSNTYYTSWMRVIGTHNKHNTNVNLGVNQIQVVLYGDNDTPAKKNFAPCELMTIARWGCVDYSDPEDPDYETIKASIIRRQRMFMISTTDGRVVKYTGVDSPILKNGNYGVTIGELPEFVKNYPDVRAILNQVGEHTDWLYAQGVVVGKFIKVDIEGNPEPNIIDCGNWVNGANVVNPTPRNGVYLYNEWNSQTQQYETHDVWHNNTKWRCLQHQPVIIGDARTYYEPTDANSAYWQKLASGGQDGEPATIYNLMPSVNAISFGEGSSAQTVYMELLKTEGESSSTISMNYPPNNIEVHYSTNTVPDESNPQTQWGTVEQGVSGIGFSGTANNTATIQPDVEFNKIYLALFKTAGSGNNKTYTLIDRETIPIVKDGKNAFVVDLENEMDSVACDANGEATSLTRLYTKVSAFYGAQEKTSECTIRLISNDTGGQVRLVNSNSSTASGTVITSATSMNNAQYIRVQFASGDDVEQHGTVVLEIVHTTYGTRQIYFTINGVRGGADGSDAVLQELLPSLDAISFARTAAGGLTPDYRDLSLSIKKTQGGTTSTQTTGASGLMIRWALDSMPSTSADKTQWGGGNATGITWNNGVMRITNNVLATNIYIAAFNSSGTLVDRETIPIIKDGNNGADGEDGEDAHEVNPNILLRTIFDKGIDFVKEKWGGNYSYISIDTSSDTVIEGRKCVRINASSLPSLNYIDFSQNVYSRIKPNTWYTLSFNYFATEQFTTYIYDGYNTSGVVDQNAGFYVDGTFVSGIGIDGNHSWPSNWNGLRHTLTFKTKSSFGTSEAIIIFRVFGGSQLAICMPKLETGDAATAYMAHEEDLKGTDGARGKIGRFFYYAQEWSNNPNVSYDVTDAEAPYFKYNDNYWVFNPTNNGTYTMSAMGEPSSSNENWELMVTDFKYIITEAIFGNYAHFGSFIINGDWMISQHGKVNGETTNSNAAVSGTTIASTGNTSFTVKAYTIFDNESPTGESDLTARGTNESISSSASSSTLASSVPLNNFYTYCLKCKGHKNSSNRPVYLRIRNSNPNCSWQAITLPTGSDSELSVYFRVAESSANYVVDLYQPTTGGGASVTEWSISRIKFAPNFAVDGLTGKTYQNDAYVKGVVEAVDGIFNGELTAGDMKVTRRQESNHVWSGMYTPSLSEAVSIGVRNYSNNSYSGEILLLGSGAAGGYVYTYAGGDETGSRFELSYAKPTGSNRSRIVLASGDESGKASITVQTTVESGASASATVIEQDKVTTTDVDTSTIHVDTIYPKTTNGYVSIPSNIITGSGTKYLPSNPQKGMVIFAKGTTGSLTISGNGKPIMGANGTNTDSSITIGNASFFFVYDGDRWIRYCCTE